MKQETTTTPPGFPGLPDALRQGSHFHMVKAFALGYSRDLDARNNTSFPRF
jgi:hypothetical protein